MELLTRLLGIWGWGLVGVGVFAVALAARLCARPPKRRIFLRASCAPKRPDKIPPSLYTPPPHRRYRGRVRRK